MKGWKIMFKKFFGFISNKIKGFVNKIRKSKTFKFAKKAVKTVGSACVIITAFNFGNITEALHHMTDAPTTIGDTARWFIVLCKEWISSIKAKNFTWDVKEIFLPFVGALIYCSSKIMNAIVKIISWIKNHKVINTKTKTNTKESYKVSSIEVVDPFAAM